MSQLLWRCRRGVRELDVLFGSFVSHQYPQLSESEKTTFFNFLHEQDPVIMDWLFSRQSPENNEFKALVVRLQNTMEHLAN